MPVRLSLINGMINLIVISANNIFIGKIIFEAVPDGTFNVLSGTASKTKIPQSKHIILKVFYKNFYGTQFIFKFIPGYAVFLDKK